MNMNTVANLRRGALALAGTLVLCPLAMAQGGYRVSEGYTPDPATADSGPVRMARFGLIQGQGVVWRPDPGADWSGASENLPIRQGSQVSVGRGSRAEIQFDDGSVLRLASGALVTLTTLYSDSKGEFTEIKLNDGLATMSLRNKYSLYQIDTPDASVKAYGPSRLRIGVGRGVEIADRAGEIEVEGGQGTSTLRSGQYAYIADPNAPVELGPVPHEDNWDRYADQRDQYWDHRSRHLPPNIALVAGNLDNYGSWNNDPRYGDVWYPQVSDSNWRPYSRGHWVWLSPYGWTWVGNEPWGWAPYHYGTWVHEDRGWGWVPGPAAQYWSPAVVQYSGEGDNVAWCPLAPQEVQYPASLTLAFSGGDWALSFSIGRSGFYYPAGPNYCVGRPWSNSYVNQVTNIYNTTQVNNYYGNAPTNNVWQSGNQFVPSNARYATYTNTAGFGRGSSFQPLPASRTAMFRSGRSFVGAPNAAQIAGPPNVRPTAASFTPFHRFSPALRPDPSVLQRAVFRSPVPNVLARHSVSFGRAFAPSLQPARTRPLTDTTASGPNGFRPGIRPPTTIRPGGSFAPPNTANGGGRMQRYNSLSKSPFTNPRTSPGATPQFRPNVRPNLRPNAPVGRYVPPTATQRRSPFMRPAAPGQTPRPLQRRYTPPARNFGQPPAQRRFTPPAQRRFSPPPAQRRYSPPPAQRRFTPPAQRRFSPPPAQRRYSPPPAQRRFTPPAQQRFSPPPAQRRYSPPPPAQRRFVPPPQRPAPQRYVPQPPQRRFTPPQPPPQQRRFNPPPQPRPAPPKPQPQPRRFTPPHPQQRRVNPPPRPAPPQKPPAKPKDKNHGGGGG